MKYEIIIFWSEEDGAFLAEAPELAGCMADGATAAGALANLEVVMAGWESGTANTGARGRLMFA